MSTRNGIYNLEDIPPRQLLGANKRPIRKIITPNEIWTNHTHTLKKTPSSQIQVQNYKNQNMQDEC